MSKKKNRKIETRTEFSLVKHEFTRDELDRITGEMTKALRNISELEEQKKAVTSDFAAKIKTARAHMHECANKLDAGYQMQEMECEVDYVYSDNVKRFFPLGENRKRGGLAKEEVMSEVDRQAQMPLNDPKKKPDAWPDETAAPAPKKGRKPKIKPGQPLVPVADALDAAEPASHKLTSVRGVGEVDDF